MTFPAKTIVQSIQINEPVSPSTANRPNDDLETNIDNLRSYLQASPGTHFEFDQDAYVPGTRNFDYSAGNVKVKGGVNVVAAGQLILTANNTNYIQYDIDTVGIIFNTTGFSTRGIPLWEVVLDGAGNITAVNDYRAFTVSSVTDAILVDYDNSVSLLTATTVQAAIDEVVATLTSGTVNDSTNLNGQVASYYLDLANHSGVISDGQHGSRTGGTTHALAVAATSHGFMSSGDKSKLDGIVAGAEPNEFSFKTIIVATQTDVVADTTTDTLTMVAGVGIEILTSGDTITYNSNGLVSITSNDSTPDYLLNKLVAGIGITLTEQNDGGDESILIDSQDIVILDTPEEITGLTHDSTWRTVNNTTLNTAQAKSALIKVIVRGSKVGTPSATVALYMRDPDTALAIGDQTVVAECTVNGDGVNTFYDIDVNTHWVNLDAVYDFDYNGQVTGTPDTSDIKLFLIGYKK